MLKYIVTVTEDLLQISIIITLLYAFLSMTYGRRGKISQWIAILAGILSSGAMAIVKNQTSKIRVLPFVLQKEKKCAWIWRTVDSLKRRRADGFSHFL